MDPNISATSTNTGTTSGTGDETSTTGQPNGTTASGPNSQNQTTQPNNNSSSSTNTGTDTTGHLVQTAIDSLPADIQTYIKDLREAKKQADKKARDEVTSKTKAEEAKLIEQNNYKGLLEKRDLEMATLQKELAELQRTVLVGKVVNNHKLPLELAKLITGTTEAELEESAKLLAKHLNPNSVNTEGGKGSGSGSGSSKQAGAGQSQAGKQDQGQGQNQHTKSYSFQKPGEVAWPS